MAVAPFYFSTLWQASIDMLGGDALVPQMTFLSATAVACFLMALSGARAPRTPLSLLVVAFLGWCALSAFGTVYRHDTAIELARVAGLVAWFFLARALLRGESPRDAAARRLCLLGAIILGAGVVCGLALWRFAHDRDPRQFSTFFNPNLLANYCALSLPLAVAFCIRARRRPVLLVCGALALLIIFGGLAVTSSKGGFLSTLVALLVFALAALGARGRRILETLRVHRKIALVAALIFIIVGGVLFQKTVLPRLRAAGGSELNSTMFRVYTWQGTLRMAQARPLFGWGPGSYPSAYPQFAITGYTRTAHQVWLQLATESGFPAALLLLALCGAGALCGARALRGDDWPVAAGGVGAVAAFVAHGCTDAGWSVTSIALLLMVTLALLDSLHNKHHSPLTTHHSLNYPWLAAASFFAILVGAHQRAVRGEDLSEQSRRLLAQGAPEMALEKAREATEADPLSARLWRNLGRVEQALGKKALDSFNMARLRQPTKASHEAAQAAELEKYGRRDDARTFYDRAVELDPNDPGIRLARAEFLMVYPESRDAAWRDYEHVAALYNAPYGKYPAVAEMVNLDFARAFLKLGERALSRKNKDEAGRLAERGLAVIARWHDVFKEARNRDIAEAGNAEGFAQEAREVEELEAQLNTLKERTR